MYGAKKKAKKDPTEIYRGAACLGSFRDNKHAWVPHAQEGLPFNARCKKCGLVEIRRPTWRGKGPGR